MLTRYALITVSGDQVSCDLSGEAAILDLVNGVYYGLDQVGAFVWNMLNIPRTVDDLCTGVMAEYDVDAEQCERDLFRLLEDMAARGLVTVSANNRA